MEHSTKPLAKTWILSRIWAHRPWIQQGGNNWGRKSFLILYDHSFLFPSLPCKCYRAMEATSDHRPNLWHQDKIRPSKRCPCVHRCDKRMLILHRTQDKMGGWCLYKVPVNVKSILLHVWVFRVCGSLAQCYSETFEIFVLGILRDLSAVHHPSQLLPFPVLAFLGHGMHGYWQSSQVQSTFLDSSLKICGSYH